MAMVKEVREVKETKDVRVRGEVTREVRREVTREVTYEMIVKKAGEMRVKVKRGRAVTGKSRKTNSLPRSKICGERISRRQRLID